MGQNELKYNDKLFKENRLTAVVSDMNKQIGIVEGMGINYFRYIRDSDVPNMSDEERVKLARSMKHSVAAQEGYIRMKKTPETEAAAAKAAAKAAKDKKKTKK